MKELAVYFKKRMKEKMTINISSNTVARKRRRGVNDETSLQDIPAPAKKVAKTRWKHFEDGESMREEAQPYRIVTARMPIHALTSTWSLGRNRPVDAHHIRRLYNIFAQGGLNRTAEENHIIVLCSRAETSKMMKHLDEIGVGAINDGVLCFDDWLSVNEGKLVEIMAGQHRVKALEAYVERTHASEKELWWTCEFYDQGTQPQAWL